MRATAIRFFGLSLILAAMACAIAAQEIVDRIAARIESDVILLSDIQLLSRYQLFLDGKSESDAQILDRLIDQWVVRTEAEASQFPAPKSADIDRSMERLRGSFDSPDQYEARRKQNGLSEEEVRALAASQLYLSSYLDSRFRPSVQIDSAAIEDFYKNSLLPKAKEKGQDPPTLDAARDVIQEALVQEKVNELADKWLKESRARVHLEILMNGGAK